MDDGRNPFGSSPPSSPSSPSPDPFAHFLGLMQRTFSDFRGAGLDNDDDGPVVPNQAETRFPRGAFNGGDIQVDGTGGSPNSLEGAAHLAPTQIESPLRRAGLLQSRSYNASVGSANFTGLIHPLHLLHPGTPHTHSQDTIRRATVELSTMPGLSSFVDREEPAPGSFIFPLSSPSQPESMTNSRSSSPSLLTQSTTSLPPSDDSKLDSSIPSLRDVRIPSLDSDEDSVPQPRQQGQGPSGLSLLRPASSSTSSNSSSSPAQAACSDATSTPMATPRPLHKPLASPPTGGLLASMFFEPEGIRGMAEVRPRVRWQDSSYSPPGTAQSHSLPNFVTPPPLQTPNENTPLLTQSRSPPGNSPPFLCTSPNKTVGYVPHSLGERLNLLQHLKINKKNLEKLDPLSPTHLKTALRSIPAVLLGCLLNILDGVSYGMIIFPATGVFSGLGPMGVSMFFVSAIVSQLVYTLGGSGFAGGNGSMMIEVVPFFHILANSIASQIGDEHPEAIIATTLVAYAFSSVLTGLVFFLLGALKLGVVVGFFPRHILVGCIGGVGVFLIITGLAVSMRIPDDDFTMSWETIHLMFFVRHNLILWLLPLALAVLLRVVTHRFHHQLIFPIYFIVIPLVFYVIVAAGRFDLATLRTEGWLFDIATSGEHWYRFYSYFNINNVWFSALWSTLPTQFALLFFNILHPPLNVPALAVSLDMDVDTDKELMAHGYSNFLSGLVGSVPNYLVYVNTLLFYRVGGTTRISSFLLAIVTFGLLVVGTGPIAYIPVMVVGALIFVLGIDLVKESLWDTRHRTSRTEYITIVSIMVCMTVWDFVIGVLFGIVVSCFFFVVQNSQRRSIRAVFTGDTAMSAVRRPNFQRAYVREVARQTTIIRLQGFLFFGTITHVEEAIRELIEGLSYQKNPVQFLVLDFTLVAGVDMSSAEALIRVQRIVSAKSVTLVLCGFEVGSVVGKALDGVGLLGAERVELFSTFNDAMEWTENVYLRTWYRSQKHENSTPFAVPVRRATDEGRYFIGSFAPSPRRSHIREAGDRMIAIETLTRQEQSYESEPLNTIIKAFSSFGTVNPQQFAPISLYLDRISVSAKYVLWNQDDQSDGMYILESGLLRAMYKFENPAQHFEESMVAGTIAGELSALADSPRNCTVVVEQAGVLWKLSRANLRRLQIEQPELARMFIRFVLKAAKNDYDILLTAIAARQ